MTDGEFSVVEFYNNDTHAYVRRWMDAKSAVELAKQCADAALPDYIDRIIITDSGDFTVFVWDPRRGVTYPYPER
jgi:hypothetical protein